MADDFPPRIKAINDYLEYCRLLVRPSSYDGSVPLGVELNEQEERVKRVALQTLSLYIQGEIECQNSPSETSTTTQGSIPVPKVPSE